MRFVFFYLMTDHPTLVAEVASRHAAYWHELALPRYLGGPFADRSGGLIIFECDTPDQAQRLVADDPFVREGTISTWWLEPWLPMEAASTKSQSPAPRP